MSHIILKFAPAIFPNRAMRSTVSSRFEPRPLGALMFCGGHDFLPDGRAVVCTLHGDVWLVTADAGLNERRPSPGEGVASRDVPSGCWTAVPAWFETAVPPDVQARSAIGTLPARRVIVKKI